MSYNLFPSFKAIRNFERMTNVSFLNIEAHPDLIVHLLYCCLIAHPENNVHLTFEEASQDFLPKHIDDLVEGFTREMSIINQFNQDRTANQDDRTIEGEQKSSPIKEEHVFLSSLIPLLITDCHLDADYVMNEFDYTDTRLYIDNYIEHQHEDMENHRFWTYLQIAPHLGSASKIKDPKDLVEFSWEKQERKEEAEKRMKTERERLIEIGLIKVEDESLTEEKTD